MPRGDISQPSSRPRVIIRSIVSVCLAAAANRASARPPTVPIQTPPSTLPTRATAPPATAAIASSARPFPPTRASPTPSTQPTTASRFTTNEPQRYVCVLFPSPIPSSFPPLLATLARQHYRAHFNFCNILISITSFEIFFIHEYHVQRDKNFVGSS